MEHFIRIAEYTFFSSECETTSRTDHMLCYKISLNKFKKTEIILIYSIFFDHNAMNVEINYKKRSTNTKTCILNNMVLNNQWVTEGLKEEN